MLDDFADAAVMLTLSLIVLMFSSGLREGIMPGGSVHLPWQLNSSHIACATMSVHARI